MSFIVSKDGVIRTKNKTIRNFIIWMAKVKVWQGRLSQYISAINFVMLFYIFITQNAWFEWYVWVVIIFGVVCATVFVDVLIILPIASKYLTEKNPVMMGIKKDVLRTEQKLDRLQEMMQK